jgi:hypothetical protein
MAQAIAKGRIRAAKDAETTRGSECNSRSFESSLRARRSISELNNIIIFDNQRKLKEGERGEREKQRKMGAGLDWRMQK